MQRVVVVGTSGSGKTTMARALAQRLGVDHIELDSLYHLPGWTPRPADEMHSELQERLTADGWVVDGNYRRFTVEAGVWDRADTIVWMNPPRRTVMWRITTRTFVRGLARRELWNGNRESLRSFLKWSDPEDNIVLWAWTTYGPNLARYRAAMEDPRWEHVRFIEIVTRGDARALLARTGR